MLSKSYLFLLLVLGLAVGSAVLFYNKPANYGLDIRGGVRLVYKMVPLEEPTDATRPAQQLTPEQIREQQLRKTKEMSGNLLTILMNRVSGSLGVVEPTVQLKGDDEVVIELPGYQDVNKAKEVLSSTASIKMYHARTVTSSSKPEMTPGRKYVEEGSERSSGKPVVTFRLASDPNKIIAPGTPEYLEMIRSWRLILQGTDLARAEGEVQGSNTIPKLTFSPEGGRKLEAWCRQNQNRGEMLAFVLDNQVLEISPLQDGAILNRDAIIQGKFDATYVQALADLLNAGSLPVELREQSSESVLPTIGQSALYQITIAGIVSFAIIALYLIAYYLFPGLVALVALALYVLFTLTMLKVLGATFSLAAIAGFILSVGMAVDANILVFERVKEEMREGRKLLTAVELGFKRALPSIVDSNACTILTSLVLVNLGTGPVKGFATTLIIGVAISLFTAFTVTRSLLVFLVGSGLGNNPKWFGLNRQLFGEGMEATANSNPRHIVEKWGRWFAISVLTVVVGFVFIPLGGLKPNVEFMGGTEAVYAQSTPPRSINQILQSLEANGIRGANVKLANSGGRAIAYVTVPSTPALARRDPASADKLARAAGFEPGAQLGLKTIGPSVQAETRNNAIYGVILSAALIIVYLSIRFGIALGGIKNGLRFGLSAIGALAHDVLVVIGIAAIVGYFMNWEISALFLTAMLTVIGFSVHDTVVIFDRIRENLRHPIQGENFAHLCNRSITQSFARSINTSATVMVTLVILILFGTPTPDLKFFCVAMLAGIASGTYSSIYNASPILWLWDRAAGRKHGKDGTMVEEAIHEHERIRAEAIATAAAQPATANGAPAQTYSQVRRRSSAITKSTQTLDEDK